MNVNARAGWGRWVARASVSFVASAMVLGLVACGGGGGGGDAPTTSTIDPSNSGTLRLTTPQSTLDVVYVQNNDATSAYFTTEVNNIPAAGYWASAEEEPPVGQPELITDGYDYETAVGSGYMVWFDTELPAGTYHSTLRLRACVNQACDLPQRDALGSVAVNFTVLPNISSATNAVTLTRTGADAAPQRTVPLTIPPEAGTVNASIQTDAPNAFNVRLDGNTLTVATTQARAGTYTGTVTVKSSTDSRFRWTLPVTYTVLPPPGGEIGLRVSATDFRFAAARGNTVSQTLTVQNPSWTSVTPQFTLSGDTEVFQVTPLGNGEYQLTFDARQATGNSYRATLLVSANTEKDTAEAYISLYGSVNNNLLYADGEALAGFSVSLSNGQVPADQVWQHTVGFSSLSGSVHTWRAQANVPWLTLNRSSGEIGTDTLTFTLNQATLLATSNLSAQGNIHITADGTSDTLDIPVYYADLISRLQRVTSGDVVGTQGTIRIRGTHLDELLRSADTYLQVTGAQVVSRKVLTQWNLGGYSELLLDIDHAVPGQAITIRWASPAFPTTLSVPVRAAPAVAAGSQTLPFGLRRGIVVHPVSGDLYLADGNSVLRGHLSDGAWTWQRQAIPRLADVSISDDGSKVFALATDGIYGLNPSTLNVISQAIWPSTAETLPDLQAPAWRHILATPSDGETYVALANQANAAQGGEVWLTGDLSGNPLDISVQIGAVGLGLSARSDGHGARALTTSATGHTTLITHPVGTVYAHLAHQPSLEVWANQPGLVVPNSPIPAGLTVAAVADVKRLFIRSDGVLQSGQSPLGPPLGNRLPEGWQAGGYGLSADGRLALVYSYRLDQTDAAHPVAAEAALFVYDISQVPGQAVSDAPQLTRMAVAPLGCTTANLATGETCAHEVAVTLSADAQGAYVLGPRGLAIVRLGNLSTAAASGLRRASAASATPTPWRTITRKPLQP